MAETSTHKKAKTAGLKKPKTEVAIDGKRRLDASDSETAREVERSGNKESLAKAIRRLNTQTSKKKELLVPNPDLDTAKKVAEKVAKGKLTIKNLSQTRKRLIG